MPRGRPPKQDPNPRFVRLPAGTMLWRIERRVVPVEAGADGGGTRFEPAQEPGTGILDPNLFSERYPAEEIWGGRFDSTAEKPDPFCYAALDDLTALAEAMLADLRSDGPRRYLPLASVIGRNLSLLETRQPLWLISLTTLEELAAARQDTWLIQSEARDYMITQWWGEWLRRGVTPGEPAEPAGAQPLSLGSPSLGSLPFGAPAGIIWSARRNPGGRALVLFESGSSGALVRSPFGTRALDEDDGRDWLNRRLRLVGAGIADPPPGRTVPALKDWESEH